MNSTLDFVVRFLQIVLIDLALSGDNAVVIGMAAASLPKDRRTKAIIIGGACAIVLRIGLVLIATWLIQIKFISAVGGAVLFWVAWRLLRLDVESEAESEEKKKTKVAQNFRQAILLILLADFMMSLDNVLAIAGAANGNDILVIVGLLVSMPLLLLTGGFISKAIDKLKWLPFLGAAVICFTGARMVMEDKFIRPNLGLGTGVIIGISIGIGLLFPGILIVINMVRAKREKKQPVD